MNDSNNIQVTGVSFTGVLTIVFIVLKLVGVINWSWIWVFSPLWINWIIGIIIVIGVSIWCKLY